MVVSKKRTYRRKSRGMRKRTFRRGKGMSFALSNRRALNPIPQRYICKMKYADSVNIGSDIKPYDYYYFRLNSIYDPDAQIGGHQPYGYDQLAPLFTGYRVFKTSWRVVVSPTTSTDDVNVGFVCTPCPNAAQVWANLGNAIEAPRSRWTAITSDQGPKVIKGHCYLPKLTGVSKVEYRTDNNYSSSIAGDPVIPMQLCLAAYSMDGVSAIGTGKLNVQIELTYHVEFIGSTIQAQS